MSQPSNPQAQDPPSGSQEHPITPVAVSPNNNDQPQPQPTVPESTKPTPSDASQNKKRVPRRIKTRSSSMSSGFKGSKDDAIRTLEDYRSLFKDMMDKQIEILGELCSTFDHDIENWQKTLSEAATPLSTHPRPIAAWREEVRFGEPAAPSPVRPEARAEVEVHWPDSGELQQMGEQIIDSFCAHTGQSDRDEVRAWLIQVWRYVRTQLKRHQDEAHETRVHFSNEFGGECFEKLLLLDKRCLEEEQTRQGKEAGDGE